MEATAMMTPSDFYPYDAHRTKYTSIGPVYDSVHANFPKSINSFSHRPLFPVDMLFHSALSSPRIILRS
ncbi:hypothetical protein Agabi119p4_5254 [Agaricus bisporus var. burnettii]|uniref:Uncharacterized protein n=1 Tax=Agaricus bisporus var. burnettii TaxID=192524 RepID=A0A8H7F4W6_AGABI|nr:hypothetical protein Agabi119p4_5254 [Agaricus bisporus var. burnettii]